MKLLGRKLSAIGMALYGVLFALCVSAEPQQPRKTYRIGFLSGGFPSSTHWTRRLEAELRNIGYVEGKNLAIESRFTENNLERLPTLANELVRLKVNIIVAGGRNDTRAARNATRTIPIIGLSLLDPVADGLLDNLARPGGNVTGFTPIADLLVGKRLELIKESIANLRRVALLWNPQDGGSARQWKEAEMAARKLGLQLYSMEVSSVDKLDSAFRDTIKTRSTTLSVTGTALFNSHQKRIAELATKNRLAAVYPRTDFVESGGLMSYRPDDTERFRARSRAGR